MIGSKRIEIRTPVRLPRIVVFMTTSHTILMNLIILKAIVEI
jgi:hypothetical protein